MAPRRAISSRFYETSDTDTDYGSDNDVLLADALDDIQARRADSRSYLNDNPPGYDPYTTVDLSIEATISEIPIQYEEDLLDECFTIPKKGSPGHSQPEVESQNDTPTDDTRTPLQRFRTAPKKPLSVTDIVSPAWCELQYWYSLSKHGRVKRTPAMKRGSSVHKVLEEQVHVAVPVDVRTREDHWGLKLWNIIQGLRTLRTTGITREFEVWGTIDGQVINGVIDELSYTCSDPTLEAQLEASSNNRKGGNKSQPPAPDQATISEFFKARNAAISSQRQPQPISDDSFRRKVYLTDVKTRGSPRVPAGSSLRPTHMQLMLYRQLLVAMASGAVDSSIVFARYNLDPDVSFSTSLIRQLSSLDINDTSQEADEINDEEVANDSNPHASLEADPEIASELLSHNSLSLLWTLVLSELALTLPHGAKSISPVLRAEFRAASDGVVMGARTFAHDDGVIEGYVKDEMRWWRGERAAKGVDVEEAFKCRVCEFAESCEWRVGKIEDAVNASRARRSAGEEGGNGSGGYKR